VKHQGNWLLRTEQILSEIQIQFPSLESSEVQQNIGKTLNTAFRILIIC
jgi:predicted transcriptional regulator